MKFSEFSKKYIPKIDSYLSELLPYGDVPPEVLHEAMRYSLFAGGKRLRPLLAIATGDIYFLHDRVIIPPACALEMIHTYSLIHDDLPSMDNDDFRRGKPTCHRKFGEAVAILAGDALLTYAFYVLSRYPEGEEFLKKKIEVIESVSEAAGTPHGMVAGQVVDIENSIVDRSVDDNIESSYKILRDMHSKKTGALIMASVKVGYILGGAVESERELLDIYAKNIGLAFQIVDDVLDEISSSEKMGKKVKKDREQGKLTYPLIFGVEKSIKMARESVEIARDSLTYFGNRADTLISIADFIVEREF